MWSRAVLLRVRFARPSVNSWRLVCDKMKENFFHVCALTGQTVRGPAQVRGPLSEQRWPEIPLNHSVSPVYGFVMTSSPFVYDKQSCFDLRVNLFALGRPCQGDVIKIVVLLSVY